MMATVDLAHPIWSDIAAFLGRTDRFFLSAVCSSCVHSQIRHDLFAHTTWRVPSTLSAADRVFRSLTMKSVIRRVVIDSPWQQAYLQHLPALESVHIAGLPHMTIRWIELSTSISTTVKSLRISGFNEASVAALERLTSLEELHLEVETVHDLNVVERLPRLSRLRLWNVHIANLEVVSRLSNLRLLESRWSDVNMHLLHAPSRLEKLVLIGWRVDSLNALTRLAPQLKLLTVQSAGTSNESVTQEAKDALVNALTSVQHLDLCGTTFASASNLTPIARLASLKDLHLDLQLSDLTPLAELHELQELAIRTTSTVDWSPIAKLKHLRSVNQGSHVGNWNPTSMPALQALPRLTQLKKPTKLSGAYPLQHLEELQLIYEGSGAVALEAKCCPNVTRLWLIGSVDIATIAACFPKVKGLQCSRFEDCENVKVFSLAKLTQLEYVRVPTGCVDYDGFLFLIGLTNMRHVDLTDLPISDLGVLRNMTRLRSLFLDRTRVKDISDVVKLECLRVLHLRDTAVRDLSSLRGHPQLRRLVLPREADWTVLQVDDGVALPNCIEIRRGYQTVWPKLLPHEPVSPAWPRKPVKQCYCIAPSEDS